MSLTLGYDDKYELWSALVQGAVDRLFVRSDELPPIGATTSIRLLLSGHQLDTTIEGTVVGRRARGGRFPGGAYIRLSNEVLEDCRRLLGVSSPERYARGRRAPRVRGGFPVRFRLPALDEPCVAQDLSETGIAITCPADLSAGQHVELTVTLDDGTGVSLSAEVVWVKPMEQRAGLRFVDLSRGASEALARSIQRMLGTQRTTELPSVVVAEDDEDSLALIRAALGLQKVDAFTAFTADEVLDLSRRFQPALVILDPLMRGLDAVDVCRLMRADVETADIPVLFFSAKETPRLHALADEAGASDFLVRPEEFSELVELLEGYLQPSAEE
jgi:CheY-like chemotaxis protein